MSDLIIIFDVMTVLHVYALQVLSGTHCRICS